MLYSIKRFWLVLMLLVASSQCVFGFALLGPFEAWQIPAEGFKLAGDDGGPKDIGDGYRFNTRTLYYACDESYAQYFGSNGIAAIDQAFLVFNTLSNLSSYTPTLSEFPLQTSRINGAAEALELQDVKSACLTRIINMLGLGQADRYVWNIHDRYLPTPVPCPVGEFYVVVQRNFDPVTYETGGGPIYSSYVNGTLYDYVIVEGCTTAPILAIAQPINVDPNAITFSTVADGTDDVYGTGILFPGRYFNGLTRDDVGGLRYLYATNRMNVETVASNVVQITTNTPLQSITTSNLALFNAQALTNTPAAFQALYPNLIITSTNTAFTNVVTTNISVQLTAPQGPAGVIIPILVTNFTTNVQPIFFYTFANLVVYTNFSQSPITTQIIQIGFIKNALAGTLGLITNTTTTIANITNGAFFIIPLTNACGGFTNIVPQLTNLVTLTNTFNVLNPLGLTNTNSVNITIITYFTNYILVANPIQCLTNSAGLREGLDKINFVRVDFDSILNTNWGPVTNSFQLTAITNGTAVTQTFTRVVNRPDILIRSRDGINNQGSIAQVVEEYPTSLNYNSTVVSSDTNGPGTIEPTIDFIFNKGSGPTYFNNGGFIQNQSTAIIFPGASTNTFFQWASFDGSTNVPVVYPDGTSLSNLEQLVFFQLSVAALPSYSVSTNANGLYAGQLQALGGTQPYTFALAPGSPGLPPGLTLNPTNGTIQGITTAKAGTTFDFVGQATDFGNRVTQANLFITIIP